MSEFNPIPGALTPSNFPRETIVKVIDGAPCFAGYGCAVVHPDTKRQVIVIAATKADLTAVFRDMMKREINEKGIYRLLTMRESDATLDEEL